jgi:hypothetical protein
MWLVAPPTTTSALGQPLAESQQQLHAEGVQPRRQSPANTNNSVRPPPQGIRVTTSNRASKVACIRSDAGCDAIGEVPCLIFMPRLATTACPASWWA